MQNLAFRTKPTSPLLSLSKNSTVHSHHCRSVSTSPYGRTHIWKRRPPVLPNPVIPKYPQTVTRSDGTSFIQWTTSPRSLIRLTRDTTNNPVWNTGMWVGDVRGGMEEVGSAGRMGRFNRKFGTGSAVGGANVESAASTRQVEKKVEESVVKGEGKREESQKEVKGGVKTKVKEDVVDLTGMNMGMGRDMGMGGSLDDVMWYEDMAKMTGGEPSAPVGKGKKEKEEKKEKKGKK